MANNIKTEHELIHHLISNHQLAIIPNYYMGIYECDVFVLNKSLYTAEYEIKKTVYDYNNDFKKSNYNSKWKRSFMSGVPETKKHDQIKNGERTNRFYFVVPDDLDIELPDYAGLLKFNTYNNGRQYFSIEKRAPLLHRNKVDGDFIKNCLAKLTWRYYGLTRNK